MDKVTSRHQGGTLRPAKHATARKSAKARRLDGPTRHVGPTLRHAMIAEAAYFRAERRGFIPGEELSDWLAAEAEVESVLRRIVSP